MTKHLLCLLSFAFGLPSTLRGGGAEADPALRAAVDTANAAYLQALKDGNAEGFASLFTEDGVSMFPGVLIKGHQALAQRQRDRLQQAEVTGGTIETLELVGSGDLAMEIGAFSFDIRAKDSGETRTVTGRYLVVWHKQADGSWKIRADAGLPDPPQP